MYLTVLSFPTDVGSFGPSYMLMIAVHVSNNPFIFLWICLFVCLFLETFSVYDLSAGTRWPTSHSRPAAGASWWAPGSSRATSRSWTASLEYSPVWLEEKRVRTFSEFKLKLDTMWDKNTWPTLTTRQKVLWLPLDGTITQKIMVLCRSCSYYLRLTLENLDQDTW